MHARVLGGPLHGQQEIRAVELTDAIRIAKGFITEAIRTNPGLGTSGPVNHFAGK